MGRLFWKFFLFLFLAQMTAVIGVTVSFWLEIQRRSEAQSGLEYSPPARTHLEAANATLQYGGIDAVKRLLQEWRSNPAPQVFIVDMEGRELLGRSVPKQVLQTILQPDAADELSPALKTIEMQDGSTYYLFVPATTGPLMSELKPAFLMPGLEGMPPDRPPPDWPPHETGAWTSHPPPPPPHRNHHFPVKHLLAGLLASFVFAGALAWYFSRPIKELRRAFQRASDGDLNINISQSMGRRRDELADLGRDFDAMATRLGILLRSQTRLLHHISHELRSPLARIQVALGLIRQSDDKLDMSLDRIEREAQRMDTMLAELLELSRLESGVMQLTKETIPLKPLLEEILEDGEFEAQSKAIALKLHMDDSVNLYCHPELLSRAIENVVRNAMKYAPEHSQVDVFCESLNGMIKLRVVDQGKGVHVSELEDIFKPFIRGKDASQTTGHGVGLAITRQIIDSHGGSVLAHNLAPIGFEIVMTLPVR